MVDENNNPDMNPAQIALARSRVYGLFSQLFTKGVQPELVSILEGLPEFEALPIIDVEAIAVLHYRLFGMNVFPFETIYLGEDRLLGGAVTESVASFYRESGFKLPDDENADHIGAELGLLCFLSGAEADALEDDAQLEVHRVRSVQRRFLDEHLLRWLPALVRAIQQQGDGFYSILADLTLALILDHRTMPGEDLMINAPGFALPVLPALLVLDKTGMKDIAAFLLTHAYTGFYLSRDDIARIGSQHRLPCGFGSREQMLTSLLYTAIDHDMLGVVLQELQQMVTNWRQFYEAIQASHSFMIPVCTGWLDRLDNSEKLLQQIHQAVIDQPETYS